MRPLVLQLDGFTAFREEQQIDFSKLELFAIAGPTGAGKSSLLDAITYALYGQVERVGDECAQLISQGLPAMAVRLEFAVGAQRWRVARRTPRNGPTRVLLERLDGAEWVNEAGQVRQANERIERLIGLDYRAFTRAVLLPQGKFDQFLKGEAKERRRILTDLLGLELYERMAKKARELEAAAKNAARAKQDVLETEYVDVTEEALDAARRRAEDRRARERSLLAAQERVRDVVRRRDDARRTVAALREHAEESARHAATASRAAEAFRRLAEEVSSADELLSRVTKRAAAVAKAARERQTEHERAVRRHGSVRDLAAAKAKAERWAELRDEVSGLREARREAEEAAPGLRKALAEADRSLAEARGAEGAAKHVIAKAEAALKSAQHDEALATVARGLKKGDACPVCGKPLTEAPRVPPPKALDRAEESHTRAEKAYEKAREMRSDAADALKEAQRALEDHAKEAARLKQELKASQGKVEELQKALRSPLGARLPADPAAALGERIDEIETLDAAAAKAEREAAEGERARVKAKEAHDKVVVKMEKERAALLALPLSGPQALAPRAVKLAPEAQLPAFAAKPPADGPVAWQEFAAEVSAGFASLSQALTTVAASRGAGEEKLFEEARAAVGALLPPASSLDELASAVERESRTAAADAATAEARAKDLEERLARKVALAAEVKAHVAREAVMHALALDVQANAIVDFLQAEALRALATEGTKRLAYLSGDRYRLRYRADEFFVVDTWNGNEERSVKTLSGGETFLASLALALSLSEQVRALAATEKARLDSLFLDEGFGMLDAETLETVIKGIELLGADGRLVGVISHVRDLTDQFPRIEVDKSPRGSRLRLVA